MEANLNKAKDGTTEVVLEYTPEEVNEIKRDSFNKIRNNLRINGFRKGKISYKMAQKLFGKDFLDKEIINSKVNTDFSDYVKNDESIALLNQPELETFEYTDDDGIIARIQFVTYPVFEVPVERIESEIENVEEVNEEIISEDLDKESIITLSDYLVKTSVDREIQEDDLVELEILETNARKAIPKEISFVVGKDNRFFDKELTKELIGKEKGKLSRLKSGNLFYDVKIKDVSEYELPEITEEFVKENFDFNSIDEFNDFLNEVNKTSKLIRLNRKNGEKILKDLIENTEIEVSPLYISRLKEDYKEYLDNLPKIDSIFSDQATVDENLSNFAKEYFILNDLAQKFQVDANKLNQFAAFLKGTQYDDLISSQKEDKLKSDLLLMNSEANEIEPIVLYINNLNLMLKKEQNA